MDLVSVIIPIYNVEAYLDRCIASVANQTYPHLEIIMVDDGSTDRSPQICDDWAKRDVRIQVIHQSNGGLSAARNSGLSRMTGDCVMLVDSDDYIAPTTVEYLMRALVNTDSDMAICGFIKGTEDKHVFLEDREEYEVISSQEALLRIYENSYQAFKYTAAWCKLCKWKLFDGITYPNGKIFEDIYTTHKLLYRCRQIVVLDVPLFYYFQRPNSIMNAAFSMKKLDYLQALVERVAFFGERGLDELESIAYDELLHSLIWEYSRTRDMLHSEEGMAYVKKLFRQVYKKGYASKRYPKETKHFLTAFGHNPEWIIWYWRIGGKLDRILKRNR